MSNQNNSQSEISGNPVPADQNPVVFKNTAGLTNLALKFTTSYPDDSKFIPDFSQCQNCSVTNKNTITNTSKTSGWDHSMVFSSTAIREGRVYLNMGQTKQRVIFGLASDLTTTSYDIIQYGIFATQIGEIQIYESGHPVKGDTSASKVFGTYTTKDVLAVERRGDTIAYLKNSVVFYISTITSTKEMHFCAAFEEPGASINAVYQRNFRPTSCTSGYIPKGFVGAGYKLTNNNTLVSTAGGGWSSSYAFGQGTSQNSKVSIRAKQTNKNVAFAMSPLPAPGSHPAPPDYNDVAFILLNSDGTYAYLWNRVAHPLSKYTVNDVFSITKTKQTNGFIKVSFFKNDIPFFTCVMSNLAKNADTAYYFSFREADAAITDVLWSEAKPSKDFFDIQTINGVSLDAATRKVSYNKVVVATINQGYMPEFVQNQCFAIINNNTVVSQTDLPCDCDTTLIFDNGSISFRAGEINGPVSVSFNVMKDSKKTGTYYRIMLEANSVISILISGKVINTHKYTTEDVLSIVVNVGVVTFFQNGIVLYTTTIKPTTKLTSSINLTKSLTSIVDIKARIFYDIDDTDGCYIMFNNKASVLAIDNVAAAVSTLAPDPDTKVEISYTPEIMFAIPN